MSENVSSFAVRPLTGADYASLYDLRGRVLRPGLPPEASCFEGDDLPTTVHLGAFTPEGTLAGIATLVENQGLQLRGMATEPALRGQRAGVAVLCAAHQVAVERNLPLWCNARRVAVGFYEKQGWRTEGDEFDIPGVGPHYVMRWQGSNASEPDERTGE